MEIFDFVRRLHDECIRLSEIIVFDKKHPRHLYLVALYGSMIELTGCLIVLIVRVHRTGAATVFRSMLEAFVELKNLHENSEYGNHMDASYNEQWIKVLKEAKNKPNPYLKDISELPNLDEAIHKYEKNLADLKKKGFRPLNIYQRFEKADMIDQYRSLYNFLSNDAHCNIQALIDRHLELHKNDFTVVYYKDVPVEDFLQYIDSAAGILTEASIRIHDYFETGSLDEAEKLRQELAEIRSQY